MGERTEKGALRFPGRKLLGFAALSCAAAPVFALAGSLTGYVPADRGLWVPFLALLVSGAFVLFPPLPGGWTLLAGAVLSTGSALPLCGTGLYGLILAIPCAILAMVMLSRRKTPPGEEWSDGLWTVGTAAAPVTILLERMLALDGASVPGSGRTWIYLGYLLLFLFHLNGKNLETSSHADLTGRKVPLKVRIQNKTAVAVLFFAGAAAVFSTGIGQILKKGWTVLARIVLAFIAFLSSLFPAPDMQQGGGGADSSPLAGLAQTEPNPFLVFLEKVLAVAAYAAAALLLFLALRFLWKRLKALWKLLAKKLSEMALGASEDYVDEITHTRELKGEKLSPFGRSRTLRDREPKDSREAVRWLYRRYLRAHPDKQGLTCREALAEEKNYAGFAGLYEKARYSDHEIPETAVGEIKDRAKGKRL